MTLTPMEQFEVKPLGGMDHPLFHIAGQFIVLHQMAGGAILATLVLNGWNRWSALAATMALALAASWVIARHLEPVLQRLTKQALPLIRAYLPSGARPAS